ncbi:hypothetical protein GUJ93_ZPchr0006g45414 [Zizania palustris]|uniref:Uncharacterized protein n=1 Tax=Zizania palustris TaxID=103762 RepID=A0A8J5VUB9_ZIZPA|nr:hypothetical protein GUJ93_ZPchr0006g45414 [Zizania palustris]
MAGKGGGDWGKGSAQLSRAVACSDATRACMWRSREVGDPASARREWAGATGWGLSESWPRGTGQRVNPLCNCAWHGTAAGRPACALRGRQVADMRRARQGTAGAGCAMDEAAGRAAWWVATAGQGRWGGRAT